LAQSTSDTVFSKVFKLNDLNTALYNDWDQYMIEAITVTIKPNNNAVGLYTNSTTSISDLYNVIDYDDASALASVAAAQRYDNCLVLAPGESCRRTFRPRISGAVFGNSVLTNYSSLEPTWIDSAYPTVEHYGMKFYVPAGTGGQVTLLTWTVEYEYFVSFRALIA